MTDKTMKKIKLYEHEIEDLKDKIRAMASDEIYYAKTQAYNGYASNEAEGDYGTWNDWFILIARFGDKIIEEFIDKK